MVHRELSVLVTGLLVTGLVAAPAAADPPQPGTEDNGLTRNESATLWSRDADTYISQAEYRQRYGESRSAVHQVANGTDISFTRPPATAVTWTRNDFEDLTAGDADTSVHPSHANLEDSVFIADAHATIFAAHPSTRGHLNTTHATLYIAPNGTVRGFVDYRVRVPNGSTTENQTVEWSLAAHEVEEVRLKADETTIATQSGSQTPVIDYQVDDETSGTLTLEADITVRLQKTVRRNRGYATEPTVTYHTESLTVVDSLDVAVYDLSVNSYKATYPNGDSGVAIFQQRPWQGYTLTENGQSRVRGVWRFYTARNPQWDTLVQSTHSSSATIESDAHPVYVHAYPSRIGPRTEPVRAGPEIIETWGTNRPSPRDALGGNITVEVVNQSYTTTYGVAVRAERVQRDAVHVAGIVRGVNASLTEPTAGSERQIRQANLTVAKVDHTESETRLRIELRDNRTGAPIVLNESAREYPLIERPRDGYLTVDGQKLETNASGVAMVTLADPGIYTVQYHPGSWLGHDPAYARETATVRWHPLGTIAGWFALVFEGAWQLLPSFVMFYAGRRLLRMLGPEDIFQRKL